MTTELIVGITIFCVCLSFWLTDRDQRRRDQPPPPPPPPPSPRWNRYSFNKGEKAPGPSFLD